MEFAFELGQDVRVLKNLDVDVSSIKHLLGQKGIIKNRYMKRNNDPWYDVEFSNKQVEPFEEDELDFRYIKKNRG